MKMFDQLLEDSFNNASVMDVRELRALYYGRINVYASFSDSTDYDYDGKDDSSTKRPYGIVCHTINSIVARKVSSSSFYANVFRIKKSGRFIEDLRNFSTEDYAEAKDVLYAIPYLDDDLVTEVLTKIDSNPRLRSAFERFWEATKLLSGKGSDSSKRWTRILLDMGYDGFADESGKGILVKAKVPVAILLNDREMEEFDVVPIQRYRVDPRRRIQTQVNKKVKRLATKRNRVAKQRTDDYRGKTDDTKSSINDFVRNTISRFI